MASSLAIGGNVMGQLRLPIFGVLIAVIVGVASAARADIRAVGTSGPVPKKAPKYEAAFHDADHKHQHQLFDMANPDHKARLADLLENGHVVELENKSEPGVSKIFSLRWDLGLWSLVVFCLLMFLLSRLAWPKMLAGLQKRESNIRTALEDAQKARDEAADLRAQYQKEIDTAHLKVKDILDEARRDAMATTEAMITKAKTEITAERDRAHRDIVTETDQALQTIWAKAAELATDVSAAALGKQLDAPAHRRLVDEALDDLRATSRN